MKVPPLKLRAGLLALMLVGLNGMALADPPPLTPPPDSVAPPPPPAGTPPAPPEQAASFTQRQLDQMVAPIALYPDPMLAQIMMASTYPLEVVKAARWSAEHPGLKGDDAVRAVADKPWDPSVKSLVAFPDLLKMMNDKLDWTEQLGDAFLAQQTQVNDTVQNLRAKAMAANNLQSNQQVTVTQPAPQTIVIEPANPDVVYVPYYDPYAVYGPWWWAGYPPVFWDPWPGYGWHPGLFFAFGAGIFVAHGFFYGGYDWGHRSVMVYNNHNYYYHGCGACGGYHGGPGGAGPVHGGPAEGGAWQHDPTHRHGVAYPSAAMNQRYHAASFRAQQQGAAHSSSMHTGSTGGGYASHQGGFGGQHMGGGYAGAYHGGGGFHGGGGHAGGHGGGGHHR